MELVWATDLHLDSVELPEVERFCASVRRSGASAMLISGDIADSTCLTDWLKFLGTRLDIPIYFVLGNHDYYGSDIRDVRDAVRRIPCNRLHYLPQTGPVWLGDRVSLVGNDGWGDCRIGDVENFAILTDYFAIRDLKDTVDQDAIQDGDFERDRLRKKLGELGDRSAEELRPHLVAATNGSESVVVLTHVPPFRESCWHQGAVSEGAWLPGFTCKAIGDLLLSVAGSNPDTYYTVLCGHSHGSGYVRMLPNLTVHTGFGTYESLGFGTVQINHARIFITRP